MEEHGNVAIFWDLDNCRPGLNITGYEAVEKIRSMAQTFGSIRLFKAYLDTSQHLSSNLRMELQASGVSLTDCPHNGRNGIASKMLIVDMIAHIIDNPTPATLVLVSGDRDYAYSIATLRLRRYRVVVICPPGTHSSLTKQASVHLDWDSEVLGELPPDNNLPPPNFPNHQMTLPSRRRADSTASRTYTPSASKSRYPLNQEDDEDDDLYLPFDTYKSMSSRINGPDDFPSSRYRFSSDSQAGRQTAAPPSRAYTFQSAKSSPPTPPLAYKTPEPTVGSFGSGLYARSFTPSLPKGFPFSEPEPISLKSPEAGPSTNSVFQRAATYDAGALKPVEPFTTTAPLRPRSTSLFGVFTPTSMTTVPPNPMPTSALPAASAPIPLAQEKPAQPTSPTPASASTPAVAQTPAAPPTSEPTVTFTPTRISTPAPTAPLTSLPSSTSNSKPAAPSAPTAPVSVPTPASAPPASISAPTPAPAPPSVGVSALAPTSNPTPVPAPAPAIAPSPAFPKPGFASGSASISSSFVLVPPPKPPTIPAHFQPLVAKLQARQKVAKQSRVRFSDIGVDLAKVDKTDNLYVRAGVSKFGKYIVLAANAGIVETGGQGNDQWISLRPEYA